MATEKTQIDSLGLYLSGATTENEFQYDVDESLGGFCSSVEVRRLGALITDPISPIIIENVMGINGEGEGTITAPTTTTLAYTAPGDTVGATTTVADATTVLLPSGTAAKAVRVRRDGTVLLRGTMTLDLTKSYNNVIGMGNVLNAIRVAGSSKYKGIFLSAHGGLTLTSIAVWQTAGSNLRISWEVPDSDNSIQTIADEDTEPIGMSWNTGTASGTGLTLATLSSGDVQGLWINRLLAADGTVNAAAEATLNFQWTASAIVYNESISGLYRIENTTLMGYELFEGSDAEPDFTLAAKTTSATLPFSSIMTLPGAGLTIEYKDVCRYRNQYNLLSQNIYPKRTKITETVASASSTVTAPTEVTLEDYTSERVLLEGKYYPSSDDNPADTWAYYLRGDGTNPDPSVDTATTSLMDAATAGVYLPSTLLSAVLGPYCYGTEVRALLRARRASDSVESSNTTPVILTIGTEQLSMVSNFRGFFGVAKQQQESTPVISITTVFDVSTNTHAHQYNGYTDFYVDTLLVFRLVYDSVYTENNGFWTIYDIVQAAQSGAAVTDTPVDVVSATEFYVTVNGIRRMKFDLSVGSISFANIQQQTPQSISSHSSSPIADMTFNTLFQVFDDSTWEWVTVANIAEDGIFHPLVWHQTATTGDFPT